MDTDAKLIEYRHSLFSQAFARQISVLDISPDGQQLPVVNSGAGTHIRILDLDTLTFGDLFSSNLAPDSDVGRIGNIYWLP